jgi:hypothetical protein
LNLFSKDLNADIMLTEQIPQTEGANESNHQVMDERDRDQARSKYKGRVKRYILQIGVLCFLGFIAGYILKPSLIRFFWLMISGTIVVLSGIAIYILNTGIGIGDRYCWIKTFYRSKKQKK